MRKAFALLMAMAMLILTMSSVAAQTTEPVEPNPECTYFEETGYNLCGEFEEFWNANGGLAIFGMPLTEAFEEENPDTGETYLVQYFERERFELHPENAGTVYEVLLGRLGAQILELQGRNWFEFEKADPSEPNYFAETGQAIAPEFWEYWSSNGLEYGDPGVSMRESLLLFGYPISGPMMETNMDGDTVLTQWFERAVFEFHPNNDEANQVLLRRLGAELLEMTQPEPEPEFEVVAEGLDNPRHLDMGMDDMLLVAEAGRGGDECVTGEGPEGPTEICFGETGAITNVMSGEEVVPGLPSNAGPDGNFASGPHSVSVGADGTIYVVTGQPTGEPTVDGFSQLWAIAPDGTATMLADLLAYEQENNPDQLPDEPGMEPGINSNPYAVLATEDAIYVADAGGNDILRVEFDGTISTYAVLPFTEAEAPEFLGLPPGTMIPVQPVPTSITEGPDGALYVGQLTGFPFPVGGASVYRLEDMDGNGDVLGDGEMTVYADGLTAIVDLEFGPDGMLYVVELAQEGVLALEMGDPNDPALGAVVRVDGEGNGTVVTSTGLVAPTGIEIADDGTIYVSNMGIFAGVGQVVKLDAVAEPAPTVVPVATGLTNPRGIAALGDGSAYVAEAGASGDACVEIPIEGEEEPRRGCYGFTAAITYLDGDGQEQVVTGLPSVLWGVDELAGPQDVIVSDDGTLYAIIGLAADPAVRDQLGDAGDRLGHLVMINDDGTWTSVADVAGYEGTANPDGGEIDSNPFSVVMTDDGGFIVSDAGANALIRVAADGTMSTYAVFPSTMAVAPPFLGLPPDTMIPMQAVPTGMTVGPDGAYYVGQLTGFPFEAGAAKVWRVMDENGDGDAMDEGEVTAYAEGFTNIIDIGFGDDGRLYVLELVSGGLLNVNPDDPATAAGALIRVEADDTHTEVQSEGLVFVTGLAVLNDGFYVSNFGVMPGAGQVVRVDQ